jgi:hypothetical protein
MMNFSSAIVAQVALHYIGNKTSQSLHLSNQPIALHGELSEKLQQYFLNPFINATEKYTFTHPESLQFNEVFNYITNLFNNPQEFTEYSRSIARHLFEQSDHPKIKGGELYIVHFKNIAIGDRLLEGAGIFKSENKAGFFEVFAAGEEFEMTYKEGIPINKIDKGCLIINDKQEPSLPVYIIDNQNKNDEAWYWMQGFLQVKPAADNYHYTKNFLTVTKQFITEHLADRENISRMDQVTMLDQSVNYFKQNEQFDINEFNKDVFKDPDLIETFQEYGTNYVNHNNVQLSDSFEINNTAVKKQSRIFKSVLKLDRNFHIYIHGNRELIEQGYDERTGRKFYKIYFEEEN